MKHNILYRWFEFIGGCLIAMPLIVFIILPVATTGTIIEYFRNNQKIEN